MDLPSFFVLLVFSCSLSYSAYNKFTPGQTWLDTAGKAILAHAGGILYYDNVYYWYGEYQDPNHVGVSCYSSTDLYNWENRGIVFYVANASSPASDYIIERPKVLYNQPTNLFVMWMHHDTSSYSLAHTAVATSSVPTGPFKFVRSFLPNSQESRDMTVYQDENKNAYLIRASGHTNVGVTISALTSDYTNVTQNISYIAQSREAPAVLQYNNLVYLVVSHCTGWDYNPPEVWTSSSFNSTWKQSGNPTTSQTCYDSQPTFLLPLTGKYQGHFIFMADRWNYPNLASASYVWLPVSFSGSTLKITNYDSWDLSIFN